MKTTADQDNILYTLIKGSSLETEVNGGIYKGERPLNSSAEDIVISAMLTSDGSLQQGVSNVNIYVPKKQFNIAGTNQLLKDSKRVSQILTVAAPILKENYGSYYSLWTSKQAEYDESEINQTRINFRIEFRLFI